MMTTSARWHFIKASKVVMAFTVAPRGMRHVGENYRHIRRLRAENTDVPERKQGRAKLPE